MADTALPGSLGDDSFDRMAREATIRFSGLAFDKLLGYALLLLVTKTYGSTAFDVYLFGVYVVEICLQISELGLEPAAIRAVASHDARSEGHEIRSVASTCLRLVSVPGLIATLILLTWADLIAGAVGRPDAAPFLRAAAVAIPASLVADSLLWSAEGLGRQRYATFTRMIAEPVVRVSATALIFAVFGRSAGPQGLGYAYAAGVVTSTVLSVWIYRRIVASRFQDKPTESHARELLRVAMPAWGSSVLYRVLSRADMVLLFALAPARTAAHYTAALSTATLTAMVARAFEAATRPLLARAIAVGDPATLRATFERSSRVVLTICLPACLALVLFPESILAVIGDQFRGMAPAMAIIGLGALVTYVLGPTASALAMAGRTQIPLVHGLVSGGLALALDVMLIPRYGAMGAALGQCSGVICLACLNARSAFKVLGVRGVGSRHLKVVAAGVAAALATYVAALVAPENKYLGLAFLLAVVSGVYLIALVLAGVEPEDKALVRSILLSGKARGTQVG